MGLICPDCRAPLSRNGAAFRCASGHSFDVAREGYVNLMRTRSTGDSGEMLRARRAFLDRGHYAPLADAVCEVAGAHLRDHGDAAALPRERDDAAAHLPEQDDGALLRERGDDAALDVLDAGCGEGYYLGRLQAWLGAHAGAPRPQLWGLDSSKDAIRMAAKRHHEARFVVADSKDMVPFADRSLAALTVIFAPRNAAEFARVLAPGGLLLIVVPSPRHLAELRVEFDLLGMEEHKLRHVRDGLAGLFEGLATRTVEYPLDLTADDMALLLTMTPSHRHDPEQRLAKLRPDARYRTTASFTLVEATCV
jgi:SAM-dependent methyltransferase